MLTNIEISMGYLWISFIFFILIFILFFNKYKYKKVKERYPSGEPRRSYYLKKGKKQGTETIYYKSGEINKRNEIIKKLFGKTDGLFWIEPPFRCDYGYNIFIGENFYANYNCTILDCAKVTIGSNVMLAPNVSLFTAGHPVHWELRNTGLEFALPITIGDNVWIGGGTIINPGIIVGDNVVIGAGSIVTKDIAPNSIAAGNPCKVLREITDEDKEYYFKKMKLFSNQSD